MKIQGFEWDEGNWPKCGKHGLEREEVEQAIQNAAFIIPDPNDTEPRLRAVGKTDEGRYAFVAFTLRERDGRRLIRPISARYMHDKEVKQYEKTRPDEG